MNLIKLALGNPTATLVGCLLVVLFGSVTLTHLPIQLTPSVEQPEIVVSTSWRAAAPEEVESEIISPGKQLREFPDDGAAFRGQHRGKITISFEVDYDLNRALIDVINRLNRVPSYPEDADEPVLSTAGGRGRPIAWFIVRTNEGNPRPIESYRDFIEEVVQTRLERITGVALSEVRGGNEYEVRITVDPYKAAGLGIDLPQAATLVSGNEDISGGTASVGKRRYTLRYAGALDTQSLSELILAWRDGKPVALRDVARVELVTVDRNYFVIYQGGHSIAVNRLPGVGAHVLRDHGQVRSPITRSNRVRATGGSAISAVYDDTTTLTVR